MTLQQEAKELVMDYVKIIDHDFRIDVIKKQVWHKAKQCALLCLDKILTGHGIILSGCRKKYEQLKTEIEKL